MSKVADSMIVFGQDTEVFGDLLVGNPGCDFCWNEVHDALGLRHAIDQPATHVDHSNIGLVFSCDDCA